MCTGIEPVRFEISRKIPGQHKYALVYQSIFFHGTTSPLNSPQQLALQVLCNSDKDSLIRFSISTEKKEINHVLTSVNQILK